jgi:hypothetical protein
MGELEDERSYEILDVLFVFIFEIEVEVCDCE